MNISKGKRDLYLPILLSFAVIVVSYYFGIFVGHPQSYATPEILWLNCVLAYTSMWENTTEYSAGLPRTVSCSSLGLCGCATGKNCFGSHWPAQRSHAAIQAE